MDATRELRDGSGAQIRGDVLMTKIPVHSIPIFESRRSKILGRQEYQDEQYRFFQYLSGSRFCPQQRSIILFESEAQTLGWWCRWCRWKTYVYAAALSDTRVVTH